MIPAVRAAHPGFLFIAEAYWDLEWALQQQGFDHCYDKRLYDRLAARGRPSRSASTCSPTTATRPGSSASSRTTTSRGRRPRSRPTRQRAPPWRRSRDRRPARPPRPGRGVEGAPAGVPRPRPDEPTDEALAAFHRRCCAALARPDVPRTGAGGSASGGAGRATTWRTWWRGLGRRAPLARRREPRRRTAAGTVRAPWDDLRGRTWRARRPDHRCRLRAQRRRARDGLYVELGPVGAGTCSGSTALEATP